MNLSTSNGAEVNSDRQITIINSEDIEKIPVPEWKNLWDKAREAAKSNSYETAKVLYTTLISSKPNIELIQYEYAQLLIRQKDCSSAVKILETLIYQQPDKLHYYLPAAGCLEEMGHFSRASTHFGTLYDRDPYGEKAIGALKGLIRNLGKLNRHSAVIPLLQQLVNRNPEDPDALLQLARELSKHGERSQAIEYYIQLFNRFRLSKEQLVEIESLLDEESYPEQLLAIRLQYLDYEPEDTHMREKIIDTYIEARKYEMALNQLLILDQNRTVKDSAQLKLIADIYLKQMSRPDKALHYLERYQEIDGDDSAVDEQIDAIQQQLAEDFVVIVQNDGAEFLWKDLYELTSDRKTIFLLIAELLENSDDKKSLIQVLDILHSYFTDDVEITYQLADALIGDAQYEKASLVLFEYEEQHITRLKFQLLLLRILRHTEDIQLSLSILKKLTPDVTAQPEVLQEVFALSIKGGDLKRAYRYYGAIVESGNMFDIPLKLHLAMLNYLDASGRFSESTFYCQKILAENTLSTPDIIAVRSFMAQSLSHKGDRFGAEQQLRELIIEHRSESSAYIQLVEYLNQRKKFDQASRWLDILLKKIDNGEIVVDGKKLQHDLMRIEANKHLAAYDYREAVDVLKRMVNLFPDQLEAKLQLIRVLFLSNEPDQVAKTVSAVQEIYPGEPTSLLVSAILVKQNGDKYSFLKTYAKRAQNVSFELQIHIYRQLGLERELVTDFDKNKDKSIESNYIFYQLSQLYEEFGMYDESLAMLNRCSFSLDDAQYVRQKEIELSFKNGGYHQFVSEELPEKLLTFSTYSKYKIGLLYARSLWADGRWKESLELYKKLLEPSVLNQLEAVVDSQEKVSPGGWAVIYSHGGLEDFDDIEKLLEPEVVEDIIDEPVSYVLNGFYSQIQWEKLVQQELNARKALKERDYFYAESQFEKLVKDTDDVSEAKLLDLATIYNRLGKHGQEAEVYETMSASRHVARDISAQVQKNKNLLKPKTGIIFNNWSKTGRDGYANIAVHEYGVSGWLHTGRTKSLDAFYSAIQFGDKNEGDNFLAHRIYGKYTAELNEDYLMSIAYGGLKRESSETTALYSLRAEGQVDEYLNAYFEISQDIVDDTLMSVDEGLSRRDFRLGFLVDSIPRIIVGGSGTYRLISDDNDQQLFHLYTSYNIFQEKYLFRIQYDIESINSHSENSYSYDENDIKYWSPSSYWQHYLTCYADFLIKDNTSFGGAPGHISLEYSLGYEDGKDVTHRGEMNIFLEMNRNILLKGTISFFDSDNYESRNGLLSIVYRW